MIKTAILTISDKGFRGERIDETGAAIKELIEDNVYCIEYYKIVPDELDIIVNALTYLCDEMKLDLVLTNGGTGFSVRDVTPEATNKVIQKHAPGIDEAMRYRAMEITPKAMLSRAIAGIRNKTLIINLPGSPTGAIENLQFVMPVLPHGIEILTGKATECAR